jgi:predicted HTH domain antitoxin
MRSVTVPDELLAAAGLTEEQMAVELALEMYRREKLSMGQAVHLARMDYVSFWRLMASRDMYIHYDVEDLEQDLATVRYLEQRLQSEESTQVSDSAT